MMPIFFHIESHLWIAYVLFFNGWLVSWLLRSLSADFSQLTASLEAQVLSAFFISIGLNGLILLALQFAGYDFVNGGAILFALSAVLLFITTLNRKQMTHVLNVEFGWFRALLYLFVFVVLFYNGGLIERVSDAWWHMSLANKIGIGSDFIPDKGHLTGMPTRYYPPLWHGNLAFLNIVSGETIPVLWNSFTGWGAVLKVMSFYLFAQALTSSRGIAALGATLFVLLPGIGNSYLRVSAWPSHIAYAAWFLVLHLGFIVLDRLPREVPKSSDVLSFCRSVAVPSAAMIFLLLVILFVHKAELLYLAVAAVVYFAALTIVNALFRRSVKEVEPGYWGVCIAGVLVSLLVLYKTVERIVQQATLGSPGVDVLIANLWPLFFTVAVVGLCFLYKRLPGKLVKLVLSALFISLLALIDWRHLASLFQPELAYAMSGTHERALIAPGWFGGELKVPGWHLQLRAGLLYSGVLALPVSLFLVYFKPSRASLFFAANAWAVFIICCSPYLYHWLTDLLQYHSIWRIAVVIFHPVIFAMAIAETFKVAVGKRL